MNRDNKAEEFTPNFYKYIDSPLMILFFEVDDMAVGAASLLVMLISSLIVGLQSSGIVYIYMVLAILISIQYSKFKKNKPNGYIYHFFYKLGLYHPKNSIVENQYNKYTKDYNIAPQHFTKKLKGQ